MSRGVIVRQEYIQKVKEKQQKMYNNQEQLKERAKVGKDAVSKFLNQQSISRESFDKIADCLEFSQEEIQEMIEVFNTDLPKKVHKKTEHDPNFVGREGAIANLNNLINEGAKVIQIIAPGGIGKTTIAKKYLANKFKTVLEFFIGKETKNIASVEGLLEEKLPKLNIEPGRELMISLDRLKQKLQTEEIGILIDNLEPALDGNGNFIEPHRSYVELLRVLTDFSVKSITLIRVC